MQPRPEYFAASRSYQQQVLQEMYESPELFNEGLLSFHYPLYVADDKELDYFLGSLVKSVGKALGGVAKTVGKIVPVGTIARGVLGPLLLPASAVRGQGCR
jgi:hypothetical protein